MKSKKVKGGFTLVELLAVIAILSIVATVGIFVSTKVIKSSKEKSYEITVNSVKNAASNYVVENPELVGWNNNTAECKTNSSCQMQCVTVQNLIDNGYFKEDILDSLIKISENKYRKVELSDSIYIERDNATKAITNVSLNDSMCSGYGNITMSVSPNGWFNGSKNIVITYVLNGKEDAVGSVYSYKIEGELEKTEKFGGKTRVEVPLVIKKNSSITVDINGKNSRTFYINTIDTDIPKYNASPLDSKVTNNRTMNFEFTDETSGLNQYYFGKTEPSDGTKYSKLANNKKVSATEIVDTAGKWYLQVVDMAGNKLATPKSYEFKETKLNIVNPGTMTASVSRILDYTNRTYNLSVNSKDVIVVPAPFYKFKEWNTKADGSGTKVPEVKAGDYDILYGITEELKITGGKVTISGTPRYNSTLTASISGLNVTSGVTYKYQWYYNSSNSNIGGTAISGATSSSYYVNDSSLIGKYIYVVVTASKENYRDGVFTSNAVGAVQKATGYINLSTTTGSKEYKSNTTNTFYVRSHHGGKLTLDHTFRNKNVTVKLSNVSTGTYKDMVTISGSSEEYAGKYTVTVTSGETATHKSASATYTLTITKATNPIVVTGLTLTYNGSAQKLVTVSNNKGDVYYSTSVELNANNYSTSGKNTIPTATSKGEYKVYYYVVGNASYKAKAGYVTSKIIDKSAGYITLSSVSSSMEKGSKSSLTFTVKDHHGGTLSVTDNNGTVNSSISGRTITLSNLSSASVGVVTVTVTSAATSTHKSASATYTLNISCKKVCSSGYKLTSGGRCCKEVTGLFGASLGDVYGSGSQCVFSSNPVLLMDLGLIGFASSAGYSCESYKELMNNCNPDTFYCISSVVWTCYGDSIEATCG